MFSPITRPQRIARILGWILLIAHTFIVCLAAIMISSHKQGSEYWPVLFAIDLPASFPVFMLMKVVDGDWLHFTLFTAIGSLWAFLLPTTLVRFAETGFAMFHKPKGPK